MAVHRVYIAVHAREYMEVVTLELNPRVEAALLVVVLKKLYVGVQPVLSPIGANFFDIAVEGALLCIVFPHSILINEERLPVFHLANKCVASSALTCKVRYERILVHEVRVIKIEIRWMARRNALIDKVFAGFCFEFPLPLPECWLWQFRSKAIAIAKISRLCTLCMDKGTQTP